MKNCAFRGRMTCFHALDKIDTLVGDSKVGCSHRIRVLLGQSACKACLRMDVPLMGTEGKIADKYGLVEIRIWSEFICKR